jgi:DNA polymerase V
MQMSPALQTINLATHSLAAGFPAAANESSHEQVSLDSFLISNPTSTVLFRVRGESMTGAGIFDGDLLVVDRSIEPVHGQVVVAAINQEMTVKRLYKKAGEIKLQAANPQFKDITFAESDEMSVWGVVTFSLRRWN